MVSISIFLLEGNEGSLVFSTAKDPSRFVRSVSTIDVASCSRQSTDRSQGLNPGYSKYVGVSKRVRPTEILKESLRQSAGRTFVTEHPSDPGDSNLQLSFPLPQTSEI